MNLIIKNLNSNAYILKPVISREKNIESIIARVKMVVFENPEKKTVLDLRKVNFLDCIKIGIIIGTYHFLEFSGKKIYILVSNEETKESIENLSFNNIETLIGYKELELAGIA